MTLALCAERRDATIFPSSARTNHRDIFGNLDATILCRILTDGEMVRINEASLTWIKHPNVFASNAESSFERRRLISGVAQCQSAPIIN
jgi:hypothetical protein